MNQLSLISAMNKARKIDVSSSLQPSKLVLSDMYIWEIVIPRIRRTYPYVLSQEEIFELLSNDGDSVVTVEPEAAIGTAIKVVVGAADEGVGTANMCAYLTPPTGSHLMFTGNGIMVPDPVNDAHDTNLWAVISRKDIVGSPLGEYQRLFTLASAIGNLETTPFVTSAHTDGENHPFMSKVGDDQRLWFAHNTTGGTPGAAGDIIWYQPSVLLEYDDDFLEPYMVLNLPEEPDSYIYVGCDERIIVAGSGQPILVDDIAVPGTDVDDGGYSIYYRPVALNG